MLPVGSGSLLPSRQGENAPYRFNNSRNTSIGQAKLCLIPCISSTGIPEARLRSSSAFNACKKRAGAAKGCLQSAEPGGRAAQVPAPWVLPACLGVLPACLGVLPAALGCPWSWTEGKQTDLGGGQEWEWGSQTGAQPKLVIMPTIQAATQICLFAVHLNIKPNRFFLFSNPLV